MAAEGRGLRGIFTDRTAKRGARVRPVPVDRPGPHPHIRRSA